MNVIVKFITSPFGEYLEGIVNLWKNVFGDSEEFVLNIMSSKSYIGAAIALMDDKLVGMAHLLGLEGEIKAFYCYAVATSEEYRGKGICKNMMMYLKDKCAEENASLLLHPAEKSLVAFYEKLGFSVFSYDYEFACQGDGGKLYEISPSEYKLQRDFQLGGKGFFGWDENVLSLSGLKFYGFDIDGEYMCAAVSEAKVCELCAPPHMLSKAARRAANIVGKVVMEEANPLGAEVSVMGYNVSNYSYFNLYLD